MNDPRLTLLIQPAMERLLASMQQAIDKTGVQLGMLALASRSHTERQTLLDAEHDLQRRASLVHRAFGKDMAALVAKDLQPRTSTLLAVADTDWAALRLVDDAEVEHTVSAARLSRLLDIDCESELRELSSYFATLQPEAAEAAFPLRATLVGKALMMAVDHASDHAPVRQQVARVLALHAAAALKDCYAQLLASCKDMQVAQAPLAVRQVSAPHSDRTPLNTSAPDAEPVPAPPAPPAPKAQHQALVSDPRVRAAQSLGQMFGVPCPEPASELGQHGGHVEYASPADDGHNLLGLMRQLQAMGSAQRSTSSADTNTDTHSNDASMQAAQPMQPFNMIRAHREELLLATSGTPLDQMVIDIVATLFDHVLSDPKVPPQMARQIARLQLPVLRVALRDQSFFHSRKHPVRRLVNRMATLATAFDELDSGPGRECMDVVNTLVQSIVEGDFDRMDVYEAQLTQLEQFISQQAERDAQENAAVAALLSGREADLRVQQRYMHKVWRELADVDVPSFLKDFLAHIWTQVLVMAATRQGADSSLTQRMKQVGHQLVLSVQPKGHPSLRQDFLRQLPRLMKDLDEGLAMIQWPDTAKQEFFAQLLPLHAQALKAPPAHELSMRLLEQSLRKVDKVAIPSRAEAANDPLPSPSQPGDLCFASALSPQEARDAGWVSEASLGTASGTIDIDLSTGDDADIGSHEVDILLDTPPPPSAGPTLLNYIQAGAAYRMLLKGQWRKVRLSWVSEGRTFFMFTHGHQGAKETISLTARTLGQMCTTGRFKAFEQAQLLERATIRARRQLAALSAHRKVAA